MKTSVKIMFCFQIILALIFIFIIKTAYASERDCLVEAIYLKQEGNHLLDSLL